MEQNTSIRVLYIAIFCYTLLKFISYEKKCQKYVFLERYLYELSETGNADGTKG
jgi:hypothetical protein